ncbi:MAG: SOS response-associated peptidase [Bacteroidota bacterium]
MCYNIEIPAKEEIKEYYNRYLDNAIRNDEWNEYFYKMSGFAFAKIPVLTTENPDKVQGYYWGLIPKWCKDEAQAKEMRTNTLNAKSETVFEKPSFRASIGSKRCLIFVKGFYEWRDYEKKKYPYYIHLKNEPVFAFGGIYETWVNKETGEVYNTVSIITTEANPLMAQIHNSKMRMPLIISGEDAGRWIDPALSKEEIQDLMKPYDEHQMEAHTISKLITSRKENPNQAAVKEVFEYSELPAIN